MVHRQTQATATHVGFDDRGVVAPGYLADLNIFDHDTINAHAPELVQDLPAGGTRLLQRSTGYTATIKTGHATVEDGRTDWRVSGHAYAWLSDALTRWC